MNNYFTNEKRDKIRTIDIPINIRIQKSMLDITNDDFMRNDAMLLTAFFVLANKYGEKDEAAFNLQFDDTISIPFEGISKLSAAEVEQNLYDILKKHGFNNKAQLKASINIGQLNGNDTTVYFERRTDNKRIIINFSYTYNKKANLLLKKSASRYNYIMSQICKNPQILISEIEITPVMEKRKLNQFNLTEFPVQEEKVLHEIFRNTAKAFPNSIAVAFHPGKDSNKESREITYRELDTLTDSFAAELKNKGIGRGDIVPIIVERNVDIVIGIYSVMKTGAAWVAIDPKYPDERKEYIIKDTKARIILTQTAIVNELECFECDKVLLDVTPNLSNSMIKNINSPEDPALIIYTSGSTGMPKGSILTHENLAYLYYREQAVYNVDNFNNSAEYAAFTFDISFHSLILHQLAGACVHILPDEIRYSLDDLEDYLNKHKIDYMVLPTQIGESFIKQCDAPNLKVLTVGGEKLRTYRDTSYSIVNAYGPSECTVYTTQYEVKKSSYDIPIGKPILNNKVYIVDKQGHLCPIGMAGELCISGKQLSKGYLNRPELNKTKFESNPYDDKVGYERIYRTGDLAMWGEDGNLYYVGRKDDQVKVRGYRIELGEVESAILKVANIDNAVVMAKEDNTGNKYLIAYYMTSSLISEQEIRESLRQMLPEYMIPMYFMKMDSFPLTQNGKIDRKKLPEITFEETNYVMPKNEMQKAMAEAWGNALNIPAGKIGIKDNFFYIGGDSIKAIQVVSYLRKKDYILKVKDIFECRTIENLTLKIQNSNDVMLSSAEQGDIVGEMPLIPIQTWFFERKFDEQNYWNQSALINVHDVIDKKRFRKAFLDLIKHHDSLRLKFIEIENNKWLQKYSKDKNYISIPVFEGEYISESHLHELMDEWQRNFDIERGPIVSAGIIRGFEDGSDRIFVAAHHLVIDGISWRILINDLENLYNEKALSSKTNSFKDWYNCLKEYGCTEKLRKQVPFWKRVEEKIAECGYPNVINENGETKRYTCRLDSVVSEKFLSSSNKAYNTQINDLLLTAFAGALCVWSGNDEIVINMEGHGREEISREIDISETIGWFTTQYPVYLHFDNESAINKQIKYVKETLRRIPDKGIGYGVIRYMEKSLAEFSHDCWASFNYLGSFNNTKNGDLANWELNFEGNLDTVGKNNSDGGKLLDVNGWETEFGITFSFDFNTCYFSEEDCNTIISSFTQKINEIVNHCETIKYAHKTASDYGFRKLSQKELEEIIVEYGEEEIEDIYPLSPLQEGLLSHAIRYPNSDEYFVQTAYDILGEIDVDTYIEAWNKAIQDNSILRTAFNWNKSEFVQIVKKKGELNVREYQIDDEYNEEHMHKIRENSRAESFDLTTAALTFLDFIHFRDRITVIVNQHHIINDGWGLAVLLEEVESNYLDIREGNDIKHSKTGYGKYIRNLIDNNNYDLDYDFWKKEIGSLDEFSQLKIYEDDYCKTQSVKEAVQTQSVLDKSKRERLFNVSKKYGVTISDIMLASWLQLIHEYSQNKIVGTAITISGREVPINDIENMVGLFINTVPIFANCIDGNIKTFLLSVHDKVRTANEHYHIGMGDIQNLTGSDNLLVDSLYSYNHFQDHSSCSKDYSIKNERNFEKIEYPICLLIEEKEEGLYLNLSYAKNSINRDVASNLMNHYLNIVDQICTNEDKDLVNIKAITSEEQKEIFLKFNNTKEEFYPTEKTFDKIFSEVAHKYPDNIAVSFYGGKEDFIKEQKYTYKQVDDMASKLAKHLCECGLKEGEIVPIIVDRNADIIIAAIAVIKAGGAYMPIDPLYPQKRIEFMLSNCNSNILLKHSWINVDHDKFVSINLDTIKYDELKFLENHMSGSSQNVMTILYTSGTTGTPKGIMLTHKNVINMAFNENDLNCITEKDNVAVHASITFDPFLMMGMAPLLAGACVQIMPENIRKSINDIHEFFIENRTTVSFLTTQLCELYASDYDNKYLKLLVTGGEKLFKVPKRHYSIANGYGPTEDCVFATQFLVDKQYRNIPIGKPMGNNKIYIVNSKGNLSPIGVVGEICISGKQLSKGYLNQIELTKQKFIENPYNYEQDDDYNRLYKTGDLGKWLSDGNIQILGRNDFQVKIRGYRIETEEIEKVLFGCSGIKDAFVLSKADKSNRNYLIGYYVTEKDGITEEKLRKYLQERLPDYMVPQYLSAVDELPMNENGKVDKNLLPPPNITEGEIETPKTTVEKELAEIWCKVLECEADKIGVKDNYYRKGGNSIKTIILASSIHKKFNIDISVQSLFENPTIKEQAALVEKLIGEPEIEEDDIKRIKNDNNEKYVLSSAQRRIYLVHKMHNENTAYNIPLFIKLDKNISTIKLENAIRLVIENQGVLRSFYEEADGEIAQIVIPRIKFNLEIEKIILSDVEAKQKEFVRPFNLSNGELLWRAKLFDIYDSEHLLLAFDFHHSIFDGFSRELFVELLAKAYNQETLSETEIQYVDYAAWENNFKNKEAYYMQSKYWKRELESPIPLLDIPTDYSRNNERNYACGTEYLELNTELIEGVKRLAQAENTTPFVVLLMAFNILLAKYSSQSDFIVGVPTIGRTKQKTEDLIGMFVGTLPIRTKYDGGNSVRGLLNQVKNKIIQGLDNQQYPLEDMIENINVERSAGHNILFDVMFALWEQNSSEIYFGESTGIQTVFEDQQAKYDLTFYVNVKDNDAFVSAEYTLDLFKKDTIERMLMHYENILQQILQRPDMLLDNVSLMSEKEYDEYDSKINSNDVLYPQETVCTDVFRSTVAEYKNKKAIVYTDRHGKIQSITYNDLDEKTEQFAKILQKKGIGVGNIVPIMVERTADIIIGAFAAMKAGAAWVSIDPKYPNERKVMQIKDCNASVCFTQSWLEDIETLENVEMICLDKDDSLDTDEYEKVDIKRDTPAVIVYTSGSTGKPKGSILTHGNLMNFFYDEMNQVGDLSGKKSAEYAAFTFDISLHTLIIHIMAGAEVHILSESTRYSLTEIEKYLNKYKIEYITLPTQVGEAFMQHCDVKYLKQLTVAGEKLKKYNHNNYRVINAYGPSEYTIYTTRYEVSEYEENIPIGSPVINTKVYVVGKDNNLCPTGIPGELWISGLQLSKGYLNRDNLTKEKYIENPFSNEAEYKYVYKTGDLVKWSKDGNLVFAGRIDDQVKVRGFRIEPAEVETAILRNESIEAAIVVPYKDYDGNTYLVGYFVSKEKENFVDELGETLRNVLPDYMIPELLIQLEEVPKNTNGKINKKALPTPEISTKRQALPETLYELELRKIWSNILNVDCKQISIEDSFFSLGGNSMKMMLLENSIKEFFKKDIKISQLFANTTIKLQAKLLQELADVAFMQFKESVESNQYLASDAQKRIYLASKLRGSNTAYNLPLFLSCSKNILKEELQEHLKEIAVAQETLRTHFVEIDGEIYQQVQNEVMIEIDEITVSEEKVDDVINEFIRSFDPDDDLLWRVGIIHIENKNKAILAFDFYHGIMDGRSINIFIDDLCNAFKDYNIKEPEIRYIDYTNWEKNNQFTKEYTKQLEYWKEELEGELPILELPTDFSRSKAEKHNGGRIVKKFSKGTVAAINNIAMELETTPFVVMLSAYKILISKYTRQNDIIVGIPTFGREHKVLENTMGMFVGTLPIRTSINNTQKVYEVIRHVSDKVIMALNNQDVALEQMIDELSIQPTDAHNTLFDVMFDIWDYGNDSWDMGICKAQYLDKGELHAKYDLTCYLNEGSSNNLSMTMEYDKDLFKAETIERMMNHYCNILEQITENTSQLIIDVELITKKEISVIKNVFNNTEEIFEKTKPINQFFEEQAKSNPNKIAAIFCDEKITYRELNEKANQLGRFLVQKGVKKGDTIAMIFERSLDMMVTILGIVKAGAAYLPIDQHYPDERIEYILSDSKTKILLMQNGINKNVKFEGDRVVITDEIYSGNNYNLDINIAMSDSLYVFYTSGSTGKPKGVVVEHHCLANHLNWLQTYYPITETDIVLQQTTYTFDISVWELFWWAFAGATVCLLEPGGEKNPEILIETIEKNKITVMQFVPSMLGTFLEYLEKDDVENKLFSIKRVFACGEALTLKQVKAFNKLFFEQTGATLHNLYGPTEATINVSYYDCSPYEAESNIPIGKPISNLKLYVCDENLKLQPVGVPGELYISGTGVAREYLHKPELTKENFIKNPFYKGNDEYYKRMYKTGDLVKWLPDGNIDFLGRMDFQVKVRGFRIELGEIENALQKITAIKDAVVLAKNAPDNTTYLVAYYTVKGNTDISYDSVKATLNGQLPEYMVPEFFVKLKAFPLTSNGKIDRKNLPEPNLREKEYVAPNEGIEAELAQIWSNILEVDLSSISRFDNYFKHGGNSLKIITLSARIRRTFNVIIPVNVLFSNYILEQQAKLIESYLLTEDEYDKVVFPKVDKKEEYPTSFAQARMCLASQLYEDDNSYNVPLAFLAPEDLDICKLQDVLQQIIEKQHVLRTTFVETEKGFKQKILDDLYIRLHIDAEISKNEILSEIKSFVRPYCFEEGELLWRWKLLRIKEDKRVLVIFDFHHSIFDGTSINIFINSVQNGFEDKEIAIPEVQFVQYVEWENQFAKTEAFNKQSEYWKEELKGELPILDMPVDYKREAKRENKGDVIQQRIDGDLVFKIKEIALEYDTTPFVISLSAFYIFLSKYSRQKDLIVGVPTVGRPYNELEQTMGMFVETLPIRVQLEKGISARGFINIVKNKIANALNNQKYPLEYMIKECNIERLEGHNALFDVMFSLWEQPVGSCRIGKDEWEVVDLPSQNAKYDISFDLSLDEDPFFIVEYMSDIFSKETINRMMKHYINVLCQITNDSHIKLEDIQLIDDNERLMILDEFNATDMKVRKNITYHELFKEAVEKHRDKIAVVYEPSSDDAYKECQYYTYGELDNITDSLAKIIRSKGAMPNTIIPIVVDRSADLIIGAIAVMKAGAAYLPIDPEYPQMRKEFIISDSKANIILTQPWHKEEFEFFDGLIIDITKHDESNTEQICNVNTENDLCYVIYTSGSTGQPKGVMIQHKALVNFSFTQEIDRELKLGTKVALYVNFTFDTSVGAFCPGLLFGSQIHIINSEMQKDLYLLDGYISDKKIDILEFPTQAGMIYYDNFKNSQLKRLVTGGEKLNISNIEKRLYFCR